VCGARITLTGGLVAIGLAVALVLSQSPQIVVGASSRARLLQTLGKVQHGARICQSGETVPPGSTSVRLELGSSAGPRVAATVRQGDDVLTRGVSAKGWIGAAVTVPLRPLSRTVQNATLCVAFKNANERVSFLGVLGQRPAARMNDGRALPGHITTEYLRASSSSWWSLLLPVARRMGLGRAWAGSWVAVLSTTLMAGVLVLVCWLLVSEPR